MRIIIILITFLFSFLAIAEELVVIQAVSSTKRTLVIRRGIKDGILKGQKAIFTTGDFSAVATVRTVNRDFSQWELDNKYSIIPFHPEDVVHFDNSTENLWTEVARIREQIKQERALKRKIEMDRYTVSESDTLLLRASYSKAIDETTSSISSTEIPTRSGMQFEVGYSKKFNNKLESSIGVRFDSETAQQERQNLQMPSRRFLFAMDFYYHLPNFEDSKGHFYLGVGAAMGKSYTAVGEDTLTGSAKVLPVVRIGLHTPYGANNSSLLFEIAAESISTDESITTGVGQKTSITNFKFSIGTRI